MSEIVGYGIVDCSSWRPPTVAGRRRPRQISTCTVPESPLPAPLPRSAANRPRSQGPPAVQQPILNMAANRVNPECRKELRPRVCIVTGLHRRGQPIATHLLSKSGYSRLFWGEFVSSQSEGVIMNLKTKELLGTCTNLGAVPEWTKSGITWMAKSNPPKSG